MVRAKLRQETAYWQVSMSEKQYHTQLNGCLYKYCGLLSLFYSHIISYPRTGSTGHLAALQDGAPEEQILVSILVSSAMMLCLREAHENGPRPLAHAASLLGRATQARLLRVPAFVRRIGYTRRVGS